MGWALLGVLHNTTNVPIGRIAELASSGPGFRSSDPACATRQTQSIPWCDVRSTPARRGSSHSHGIHDTLQDVLLRNTGFHVLDEVIGLCELVVAKVVDDQVQLGLRDVADE